MFIGFIHSDCPDECALTDEALGYSFGCTILVQNFLYDNANYFPASTAAG